MFRYVFGGKPEEEIIKADDSEDDDSEDDDSDTNSNTDSNTDSDTDSDNEERIPDFMDYVNCHYNYNGIIYGMIHLNPVLDEVKLWRYNRPLNKQHVKYLRQSIVKNETIYGCFSLAHYTDDEGNTNVYLIDGQHRFEALKQIKKAKPAFDLPIIVHVYVTDTQEEIVNLFRQINKTHPLDPREVPKTVVVSTVEKLLVNYSSAVKKQDKVYYPNISSQQLFQRLLELNLDNVSVEKLYGAIMLLNTNYYNICKNKPQNVPGIRKKVTKSAMDKVHRTQFYLGLDESWSWIEKIQKLI